LRWAANNGHQSPHFTGATIEHLTGRSLAALSIPLPPVAEQARILSRINELMALCNELETANGNTRETTFLLVKGVGSGQLIT
jgi:type I restriction enzyme S subunit